MEEHVSSDLESFKALKLDNSYRPVSIVNAVEALVLCIVGKASAIEEYAREIRSASNSFKLPAVIVLNRYVKFSFHVVTANRANIIWRDKHICQYCAKKFPTSELTMDHIVPKSKFGANTWENLVAACKRCNQKKADLTPSESGMYPIREPREPRVTPLSRISEAHINDLWKEYLWSLT